ncbi:MAG: tetratricopeptide repeat protein, partial [Myxococcales bacterium]|nr:tetratricopeptide repeat protein [Myxococcales bacterium]
LRVAAVLGIVALSGVATAAAMEGMRRHERSEAIAACELAGATIDELWNDDVRGRLHDAFVATGASYAETTAQKVMPLIDAQAEAWRAARTDACLDATVDVVWDAATLDRSLWCLDERRMDFAATLAILLAADAGVVEKAVAAVSELSNVDPCRDTDLLARLSPPAAERRDEIRGVRAELAHIVALEHAGKFDAGRDAVATALVHAEALGWRPLVAELHLREASVFERLAEFDAAERGLGAAYFEAARIGAWDIAAEAATDLIFVVGERGHRLGEAIAWSQHAELALAYAGDRTGIKEGHRKNGLAVAYGAAGDFARSRALHEETIALEEAVYGHEHPNIGVSLHNLGNVLVDVGELAAAEPLYRRTLAIFEATLGPDHPDVGAVYNALAVVAFQQGDAARARGLHERGIAIIEAALGPDHPSVAGNIYNFSNVLAALGEYPRARELQERALAVFERSLGPDHPNVAAVLSGLATVLWAMDEHQLARERLERALAINEKELGRDHPALALSLTNLAEVYTGTGDREGAVGLYERALTIYDKQEGPENGELQARFGLAKNYAKLGRESARARALAESARDGWKAEGAGKAELLAEVEEWLAMRGRAGRAPERRR